MRISLCEACPRGRKHDIFSEFKAILSQSLRAQTSLIRTSGMFSLLCMRDHDVCLRCALTVLNVLLELVVLCLRGTVGIGCSEDKKLSFITVTQDWEY